MKKTDPNLETEKLSEVSHSDIKMNIEVNSAQTSTRSQEKEQQSYCNMLFRSDWTGNYLAFVHDVRTKMRSALMS